jgi:two-component system, response regulator
MNPNIASQRIKGGKSQTECSRDKFETGDDFEAILAMAQFIGGHIRGNMACVEQYREILKRNGETEERLNELDRWHESSSFTKREKAALTLSESISLKEPKDVLGKALAEARRYFNVEEMVNLTLAIMALNDWLDLHAGRPMRVLVVEDSPYDQELLRRQLSRVQMDESIVFVSDAAQALDLLIGVDSEVFRQELLAIFLDIHLPGMDGMELMQRIRIMPGMANLPVIVMTSSKDPCDMEECRRLKVMGYVEKPVTLESFSHALANIFHNAKESSGHLQGVGE